MRVHEGKIREIAQGILENLGVSKVNAEIIVDTLICADRRGIHTHGVGKIGDYIDRVRADVLDPEAEPQVDMRSPAAAFVNAKNGFGQLAAYRAMEAAIAAAKQLGVGLALTGNSNHFGIASYYSMMAAQHGLVGITMTNASAGIAPFGAKEVLYGTNPLSIAVPSKSRFPIVLDMSSSVVARGKIRQALTKGTDIPLGWARDEAGMPTTDPKAALKGSLEPVGGPKGAGLALMIELLCGVLSGSSLPGEVRVIKDTSAPCRTSHLFIAINPAFFVGEEAFLSQIDRTIEMVKALTPIADAVYLPGELESMEQKRCDDAGLELTEAAVRGLIELSGRLYTLEELKA